jgi:hypothetical protein
VGRWRMGVRDYEDGESQEERNKRPMIQGLGS